MTQYRKKPVVIDAVQNLPANFNQIRLLAGDQRPIHQLGDGRLAIDTLEGVMTADVGDFIIRGVKGEVYPCKPDIFAATYGAVDEGGAPE